MNQKYRYFAIYKPFEMLSQFSDEGNKQGLKHLFNFPTDIYPVGRLDADSEGLLLLTNDNHLKHRLLEPKFNHQKTYLAQIEGIPGQDALEQLTKGVDININGKIYRTKSAKVVLVDEPDFLPERVPPIRFRANIPTSWLQITITEGKNRQVRKMTAKVGLPTLRLVRISIEQLELGKRESGEVWELGKDELYKKLNLKNY